MVGFMIYNTGSLSAICDPGSQNDTDSPGQIRSKLFFTQNMEISRGLPLPDTRMTRKDGGNIECCLPCDISSIIQALPFEKIQDNSVL